jgi:purine-nucleoside phosphorylase
MHLINLSALMLSQIKESTAYIQSRTQVKPSIGIILGTGLGGLVKEIEIIDEINYEDIPNFPVSTVESHSGKLIFGRIGGKNVVAMQGRFHYYEGYDMEQVTFPVRVMKILGVTKLIVSNASGGVNPNYKIGSVILIKDHINMMPEHPLRGKNDERFGPRFLNMSEPYSKSMIQKAKEIAASSQIDVKEGVYMALQGPTFETLSEYRMVKNIGADCVGMSTVPEVIVARHMDMEVFGLSVITDMGDEENIEEVNHLEVLKAAEKAEPSVRKLIKELIIQY